MNFKTLVTFKCRKVEIIKYNIYFVCISFILFVGGCSKNSTTSPEFKHITTPIGRLFLNETNSFVDVEFTMPKAIEGFICLDIEGVRLGDSAKVQEIMKILKTLKLRCVIYTDDFNEHLACSIFHFDKSGQVANWHTPALCFVVPRPLIKCNPKLLLEGDATEKPGDVFLLPTQKYRLRIDVRSPVKLETPILISIEYICVGTNLGSLIPEQGKAEGSLIPERESRVK
jgi:hypothetical protein